MPITRFSVPALAEVTRDLAAVASGRATPDLILTGARVLCPYTERWRDGVELWIARGRIAAVQPAGSGRAGPDTRRFDTQGGIIAPGLVDPHVHIESSMVTAGAYAEAALINGTTTLFCDSHEIGNVAGVAGIEWMLEDARRAPLNIFLTVPSTVPATNSVLETAGGDLTPERIAGLFDRWPEAVALGEKMDFVPVCLGDERAHAILAAALRRGRPVCGHVYGREFVAAYAASGVTDTHEAIDRDIAADFLAAGMWIFLRGGPPTTPWHSLPHAIRAVTELGCHPKRVCVCTDDRDADDLLLFGLDWVVRQAVVAGLSPLTAWSLGSLHPATRYGLDGELGGLGHGRRADLVLLDDDLRPRHTWYGGEHVVADRQPTPLLREAIDQRYRYPTAAYRTVTVNSAAALTATPTPTPATVHALRAELPGILVPHVELAWPGGDAGAWEQFMATHDLCHLTVLERHGRTGGVGHGVLQNFGLRDGAVGSSVGHDAHNLVLAGTSEADLKVARDALIEHQGGVVVVRAGQVVALVPLPVTGLLSDLPVNEVAAQSAALKIAWLAAGCTLPYMGFNLLPLSVIPAIRLTDKGLVLVPEMKLVPLFEVDSD